MYSKLITLLIPLFILTVHASCQNTNPSTEKGKQIDTTKSSTEIFFNQIMQLQPRADVKSLAFSCYLHHQFLLHCGFGLDVIKYPPCGKR